MRVLVCGSRDWSFDQHGEIIFTTLDTFNRKYPITTLIQGECRGVDLWAKKWASIKQGIPVLGFRPNWEAKGKAAGPERNLRMIREGIGDPRHLRCQGKPDCVFAFTDDLETSKGTKNMVTLARNEGIPVYLHGHGLL